MRRAGRSCRYPSGYYYARGHSARLAGGRAASEMVDDARLDMECPECLAEGGEAVQGGSGQGPRRAPRLPGAVPEAGSDLYPGIGWPPSVGPLASLSRSTANRTPSERW